QEHPRRVRVADRADRVADHADLVDQRLVADQPTGDEIAVAADIFGEAVDREVGALIEWLGPQRPEERIVDRDRRPLVGTKYGIARGGDRLDVHQHVRRIGWAFEIDQRDSAQLPAPGDGGIDLLA